MSKISTENLRVSHSLFTSGYKTSKVIIEKREKKPLPILFLLLLKDNL